MLLYSPKNRFQIPRDNYMGRNCSDSFILLWIYVLGITLIPLCVCVCVCVCVCTRACMHFADQERSWRGNALPLSSGELRQIYGMYLCAEAYQDRHKNQCIPETWNHLVISLTSHLLIKEKHPTTIKLKLKLQSLSFKTNL
jgi:hypothetical protein